MAEILIYEDIVPEGWPWGVSPLQVIEQLKSFDEGDTVTLRLNSPGGDVVSAIAMYNAFDRWSGPVVVEIDARAASAASLLAMVGDRINIAPNAEMMLHEPYTVGAFNLPDAESFLVERLRTWRNRTADMYAQRSGRSRDDILEAFNGWDGTYFNAEEAVEFGLADKVTQQTILAEKKDSRFFQMVQRPEPEPKPAGPIIANMRRKLRLLKLRS